jgi:hypothetical protein
MCCYKFENARKKRVATAHHYLASGKAFACTAFTQGMPKSEPDVKNLKAIHSSRIRFDCRCSRLPLRHAIKCIASQVISKPWAASQYRFGHRSSAVPLIEMLRAGGIIICIRMATTKISPCRLPFHDRIWSITGTRRE